MKYRGIVSACLFVALAMGFVAAASGDIMVEPVRWSYQPKDGSKPTWEMVIDFENNISYHDLEYPKLTNGTHGTNSFLMSDWSTATPDDVLGATSSAVSGRLTLFSSYDSPCESGWAWDNSPSVNLISEAGLSLWDGTTSSPISIDWSSISEPTFVLESEFPEVTSVGWDGTYANLDYTYGSSVSFDAKEFSWCANAYELDPAPVGDLWVAIQWQDDEGEWVTDSFKYIHKLDMQDWGGDWEEKTVYLSWSTYVQTDEFYCFVIGRAVVIDEEETIHAYDDSHVVWICSVQ